MVVDGVWLLFGNSSVLAAFTNSCRLFGKYFVFLFSSVVVWVSYIWNAGAWALQRSLSSLLYAKKILFGNIFLHHDLQVFLSDPQQRSTRCDYHQRSRSLPLKHQLNLSCNRVPTGRSGILSHHTSHHLVKLSYLPLSTKSKHHHALS